MHTRTLGEIIRETVAMYQAQFVAYIIIAGVGAIAAVVLSYISLNMLGLNTTAFGMPVSPGDLREGIMPNLSALPAALVLGLLSGLIGALTHMALVHAASEQTLGRAVDAAAAWSRAAERFVDLFLAYVLVYIAVLLMAITIIGIPFAIYFGVRWGFIVQAVLIDGKSPREALSRSSDLVRGQWWRVLGISLVVGIIAGLAAAVIGGVLFFLPFVGAVVASALITPVVPIAQTLLYYDLRARLEGGASGA
jgi:hypothetical protein